MRRLFLGMLLLVPVPSLAFIAIETDQSQPYEIVPVEAPLGEARYFLGELEGFPIMYEVTAADPFTFTATVRQPAGQTQQPFSLIVIRQNDRGGGVREIARMNQLPEDWSTVRDGEIGLSFTQSEAISKPVEPGIYRIEVSTPQNAGKYLLQIGSEPADTGYFAQLGAARTTQAFFGYGIFSMLGSSLVFYPLGILLLLFGIYKTWQYRHVFKHGTA